MVSKEELDLAKNISIISFLESKGSSFKYLGNKAYCHSPFTEESTPSFCVYLSSNRFVDYSSGHKGDIVSLVSSLYSKNFIESVNYLLDKDVTINTKVFIPKKVRPKKKFNLSDYLTDDKDKIDLIKKYADSRKISRFFFFGVFRYGSKEIPSILFPSFNEDMEIVGARLRSCIQSTEVPRFYKAGENGVYVIDLIKEDHYSEPFIIFSESETSSNSLAEFIDKNNINAVIICFGGVSNQAMLPKKYQYIKNRKVLIDYDGDENKYLERIKRHEKLGEPIKLILPKGEDINSLYCKNKLNIINNLI